MTNPPSSKLKRFLLSALNIISKPFWALLALLLLFEEWLWEKLKPQILRLAKWLGRYTAWARFEAWLSSLSPRAALIALILPWLLLLPAKLAVIALLAKGRALIALVLAVLSKLLGTALLTRVFALTRPQLMTMPWFARLYARITDFLARAHAWLREQPVVLNVRAWVSRMRQAVAGKR
jgi:hypothetical protein